MPNSHIGKVPEYNIDSKKELSFMCESCNYFCKTKFLYKQHCSTKKHKRNIEDTSNNNAKSHLCSCGKQYNHIQSYRRHVSSCGKELVIKKTPPQPMDEELMDVITKLISQNQNILLENKEMREIVKGMIPKIGKTVINNKFNLQIFLNEKCKDAINLTEFVQNLTLNLYDLN